MWSSSLVQLGRGTGFVITDLGGRWAGWLAGWLGCRDLGCTDLWEDFWLGGERWWSLDDVLVGMIGELSLEFEILV